MQCIIVPNHEWGGNGSLGCDVGYGLLHRIPRRKRETETVATNEPAAVVNEYSQDIFNAPDYPEDELEEAKQTLLPPSPTLTQQDDQLTHQG